MQQSLILFARGDSVLQEHCSPDVLIHRAKAWASHLDVDEVLIVPTQGLRAVIHAYRKNVFLLKGAIRNMPGVIRVK